MPTMLAYNGGFLQAAKSVYWDAYRCGIMWTMESAEERARQRLRKLARDRRRIAATEVDAIVAALRLGVRQVDVARDIDRTREHIRRIADRHHIPSRYARRTERPQPADKSAQGARMDTNSPADMGSGGPGAHKGAQG